MVSRWVRSRKQRRLEKAGGEFEAWGQVCGEAIRLCAQALADSGAGHGEIGIGLDKTDRTLFGLRDHASAVTSFLARRQPGLARKLNELTDDIFVLRNQTVRFLIRAQGPTPSFLDAADTRDPEQGIHRLRALQDVGMEARRQASELSERLTQASAETRSFFQEETWRLRS